MAVVMVKDIGAKRRAEEERLRHIDVAQFSSDAIISTNLQGVIASWNNGAQRMFGYTESEAIGKSIIGCDDTTETIAGCLAKECQDSTSTVPLQDIPAPRSTFLIGSWPNR